MCSDFSLNNITNKTVCSFSFFPLGKIAEEEVKPCTDSTFWYIICGVSCFFNNTHTRRQSTPRRGVKHIPPRAFSGDDFRSSLFYDVLELYSPRGYLKTIPSRGIISIQYILYNNSGALTVVILRFPSINLSILL